MKTCDCKTKRYQVVKGSESGHCCFEATVIDTAEKVAGHPDWACECFDVPRAYAIADAMNAADEAPLSEEAPDEKSPEPTFQDCCGKEFDAHSALLYFLVGKGDPKVVIPCEYVIDTDTGTWEMHANSIPNWVPYEIRGFVGEKHPAILKLEASVDDIRNADI
jgi:hypothetical protein